MRSLTQIERETSTDDKKLKKMTRESRSQWLQLLKMSKPLLEESDVGEQKRHHEKASEGDRKQFVSEYVGKLLIVFAQRDIIFPF